MPFFLDIFPYILRMRLSCRQPICLALPFLLGLGPLPLKADKVEKKELCHYRFKLPSKARIASQKQDLFIANAKYGSGPSAVGIQWLFSCTENLRRTSQSSEIMRKIREEGELLHHHETLHVDQNLEALFFSRTRIKKGRRLSSIEAYFAARNHEYHFYALAKDSEPIGINKEIHSELLAEMKKLLHEGRFTVKVESTITEAQFQVRLYAMTGLFLLLGLLIVFLLIWRVYRRKRRHLS